MTRFITNSLLFLIFIIFTLGLTLPNPDDIKKWCDKNLEDLRIQTGLPSLYVTFASELVVLASCGASDPRVPTPLSMDTLIPLDTMSFALNAVFILRAVTLGHVSLSTPLCTAVPLSPCPAPGVTVAQVLTRTSMLAPRPERYGTKAINVTATHMMQHAPFVAGRSVRASKSYWNAVAAHAIVENVWPGGVQAAILDLSTYATGTVIVTTPPIHGAATRYHSHPSPFPPGTPLPPTHTLYNNVPGLGYWSTLRTLTLLGALINVRGASGYLSTTVATVFTDPSYAWLPQAAVAARASAGTHEVSDWVPSLVPGFSTQAYSRSWHLVANGIAPGMVSRLILSQDGSGGHYSVVIAASTSSVVFGGQADVVAAAVLSYLLPDTIHPPIETAVSVVPHVHALPGRYYAEQWTVPTAVAAIGRAAAPDDEQFVAGLCAHGKGSHEYGDSDTPYICLDGGAYAMQEAGILRTPDDAVVSMFACLDQPTDAIPDPADIRRGRITLLMHSYVGLERLPVFNVTLESVSAVVALVMALGGALMMVPQTLRARHNPARFFRHHSLIAKGEQLLGHEHLYATLPRHFRRAPAAALALARPATGLAVVSAVAQLLMFAGVVMARERTDLLVAAQTYPLCLGARMACLMFWLAAMTGYTSMLISIYVSSLFKERVLRLWGVGSLLHALGLAGSCAIALWGYNLYRVGDSLYW